MSNETIAVYTIGFSKKGAAAFFGKLEDAGVRCVIDVRLRNMSHLAGFTKRDDLRFFLRRIGNINYVHVPELAPKAKTRSTGTLTTCLTIGAPGYSELI